MSNEYLELYLPAYLKEDIENLKEAIEKNIELRIDVYIAELKSSINVAYYDGLIDENQARYLREKYLGQREE